MSERGFFIFKFMEIESTLRSTELKAVNGFLRSIFDAAGDPIVLIGTDYEVKFMNRAAQENFVDGREKEAAYCYQLFYDRNTPCCGTAYPCSLERVRESLRPFTVVQEHPK